MALPRFRIPVPLSPGQADKIPGLRNSTVVTIIKFFATIATTKVVKLFVTFVHDVPEYWPKAISKKKSGRPRRRRQRR